jgi:hypothetical protein
VRARAPLPGAAHQVPLPGAPDVHTRLCMRLLTQALRGFLALTFLKLASLHYEWFNLASLFLVALSIATDDEHLPSPQLKTPTIITDKITTATVQKWGYGNVRA